MFNYKKEFKKYKRDLLLIITTNYCAMRYVKSRNKEVLEQNRNELSNELGNLRNFATKFEAAHPDRNKWNDAEKEENEKLRNDIIDINKKIEMMDIINQQIDKFNQRVDEAVFIFNNFDIFSNDVKKIINK